MDYKATQNALKSANRVPDAAKRHVTPVGTGGSSGPQPKGKTSDKGYYRKSDIDKFFSDVLKGRYKGQQSVIDSTEKAIEQAYVEGRVLHNQ